MKTSTAFLCIFFLINQTVFGQEFIQLSKKIPQAVLPYSTNTEFLDVELFESLDDYSKHGLVPITDGEVLKFIDNQFLPKTERYFGVHRLQLTAKIIGIVYYKQVINDDDFESSTYNFLITTYSLSGNKLSTFDFIGYEWMDEQIDFSEEELEEEENFEEIEEDFEEIEYKEYDDTLMVEPFSDLEMPIEQLDEGYSFSTVSTEKNDVWLERKSVSYYSKELISTSYFKLNTATGEFEEVER